LPALCSKALIGQVKRAGGGALRNVTILLKQLIKFALGGSEEGLRRFVAVQHSS
jgi:hypothetical protein